VSNELSPQAFLWKLVLQASERQPNHVSSRDRNAFKLRLRSDPPDPLMLFGGQRSGDLVVGLRSSCHHASSLASGHLDGKSLPLHHEVTADYDRRVRFAGMVPV
jgi:hypothetical protein